MTHPILRYVVVRDFERVVAFQFNPEGEMADCQIERRNQMVMGMLDLEVSDREMNVPMRGFFL